MLSLQAASTQSHVDMLARFFFMVSLLLRSDSSGVCFLSTAVPFDVEWTTLYHVNVEQSDLGCGHRVVVSRRGCEATATKV